MRASRKMWHENQRAQSPEGQDCRCQGRRASPANVKIKVGGGIIRLRLPTKTVEQLKLARGKTAYAVIKMSDFMVELD
jgi:molybdopterin-binding protein